MSAPAGTGKTTLVADWVRTRRAAHTTGWVSFEEGDEALWPQVTTVLGDLGVDLSVRPISSAPHSMDAHLLSALAGAVTEHASPLTIVLDHFELTDLDQAHDLDYLLRHCAGRLQVVVTTRVDPVLPLYRYRLANSVTEVRAADLAFTDEEAADVLVLSGFRLRPETVRALNTRTNGWVTGLRFAARALAGADDPDRAVARVIAETGDMGEYLLGEVLDAQEPAVRALLLESSIPDVLHPGLVEALPHHSAVRELGMLTRMNVFVEALEDSPGCYRYPPFFRELLRAQLAYESPDRPGELHRICARWFVDHGSASAAIGHLAATGAWPEAAARTIEELLVSDLLRDGSRGGLGRVLRDMPEDVGTEEAALVRAALALADGDLKGSADALDAARDARGAATVTWPVELTCAVLDAVTARFGDDLENADVTVAQALEVASADDHRASLPAALGLRALSLICRGTAALRHGDLPAAATAAAAAAESTLPGLEWIEQAALGQLAMVQAIAGELEQARRTAAEAAAVADCIGLPSERRSPAAALGMALVSLEQYDLDAVDAHLEQASRPLLATENPVWRGLLAQVRAGLLRARG
ncbi:MAG TPA: hypothetical protein VLA97_02830, partial [Nocardioidaceae bacterium]|nr:hypothetical protein [Nocardioidaceae bacterium]